MNTNCKKIYTEKTSERIKEIKSKRKKRKYKINKERKI